METLTAIKKQEKQSTESLSILKQTAGLPLGEQNIVFDVILATANLLALIVSVFYLLNPLENVAYNIFGSYMFLVLVDNLATAAIRSKNNRLTYSYIIFTSVSMLMIPILNTIASANPVNISSRSAVVIAFILFEFAAGSFLFGYGFIFRNKKKINVELIQKPEKRHKFIIRIALLLMSGIVLIFGIYICYDLLTRRSAGIFEVFLPEYSLFFGLYFLSVAAFAVKLSKFHFKITSFCIGILGVLLFFINLIPILSVPKLLHDADRNYIQVFGEQSKSIEDIPEFKNLAFSIPEYLFGTVSGSYTVKENILFYKGTQGVDQGIKLYFDAYMPAKEMSKLPGKGSVLIRIHGGAWNIGDKGASNYAQVNKYFASQGYVVFDIQYGLNNKDKFVSYSPVQQNVEGAFNIDDMVRHIGLFTTYLYEHKSEFSVNTDSVFISGGSAGGQLTVATGLALANENYAEVLDSRIKIKGIIPFYPANGLARIGGKAELVNPALLVNKNSPPCLIYQGTKDGIVNPQIAKDLKSAYAENGNEKCALIMMPFASHGSDFYFSSYYNQVFLYYMERFMLLHQ